MQYFYRTSEQDTNDFTEFNSVCTRSQKKGLLKDCAEFYTWHKEGADCESAWPIHFWIYDAPYAECAICDGVIDMEYRPYYYEVNEEVIDDKNTA